MVSMTLIGMEHGGGTIIGIGIDGAGIDGTTGDTTLIGTLTTGTLVYMLVLV